MHHTCPDSEFIQKKKTITTLKCKRSTHNGKNNLSLPIHTSNYSVISPNLGFSDMKNCFSHQRLFISFKLFLGYYSKIISAFLSQFPVTFEKHFEFR